MKICGFFLLLVFFRFAYYYGIADNGNKIMGESRNCMKESGGGGGGGGSSASSSGTGGTGVKQKNIRALPSTTYSLRSTAAAAAGGGTAPSTPQPTTRRVYISTVDLAYALRNEIAIAATAVTNSAGNYDHVRHCGSESDSSDDGKVTTAGYTSTHLLYGSNETQTEEDDEATLRELLVRYVV